jgi:DNA replication protein DnaC
MDEGWHPEAAKLAMAVERWCKRCITRDAHPRLMVICGANGIGKSMAARAAARYVTCAAITGWEMGYWPEPPRVRLIAWSRIAGVVPSERSGDGAAWDLAIDMDVVVLDDVGAEVDRFKNDLPVENLRLILEERRDKWTLITTNLFPEDFADKWDDRVADRLYRNSEVIALRSIQSYQTREQDKNAKGTT